MRKALSKLLFFIVLANILFACNEVETINSDPEISLDLVATPEVVSVNTPSFSQNPNVVINQNGDTIVVWYEYAGTADSTSTVFINTNTNLTGWDVPTILEPTIEANTSGPPNIAMNDNGDAFVGWGMKTTLTSIGEMWVKRYTLANGWEPAMQVNLNSNPNTNSVFRQSDIAIDEFGNAVAVWTYGKVDGSTQDIWTSVYTLDQGWGSTQYLGTTGYYSGSPQVAMRGGNAIAVWNNSTAITAYTYQAGVGWNTGDNFSISDGDSQNPQVAMSTDGSGIVVWEQEEYAGPSIPGSPTDIYATHFNGTIWSESVKINPVKDLEYSTDPKIAMDANGNAIAAWINTSYGIEKYISASYYNKSLLQWGVTERISPIGGHSADVAMNSSGSAVVSWVRLLYTRNGYITDVNATRFSNYTGWGPSGRISNTISGSDIDFVETAINNQGNFVTVWEKINKSSNDRNTFDIWASQVE